MTLSQYSERLRIQRVFRLLGDDAFLLPTMVIVYLRERQDVAKRVAYCFDGYECKSSYRNMLGIMRPA